MNVLTHHDLCSGILGFHLAAQWAGFTTTVSCEINPFCAALSRRVLPYARHFQDLSKLDGSLLAPATVVTAGIPCQPYSQAGLLGLHNDDRYLWPALLRYLTTNRPHWLVLENVSNFADVGLDLVQFDLEKISYRNTAFTLPACSVGLPHNRKRVFLVANSTSYRLQGSTSDPASRDDVLLRCPHSGSTKINQERLVLYEPRLCRTLNGVPDGVDRIKALGNTVVPQLVYNIMKTIAYVERQTRFE